MLFCSLSIEPGAGGMQRFDRRVVDVLLARAGDGTGARPVVHVLFDHPEPGNGGQEEPGVRRFGRARLRFLRETLGSIRRGSGTLLLGHILFLPLAVVARVLRPRLRVLLFVHGIEVWGGPGRHRRRWYEPILLRLAVDHVIAVSTYTADIMAARFAFPRQRISVLPNAVDPLPVPATAERNGPPVVLVVARLEPARPGQERRPGDPGGSSIGAGGPGDPARDRRRRCPPCRSSSAWRMRWASSAAWTSSAGWTMRRWMPPTAVPASSPCRPRRRASASSTWRPGSGACPVIGAAAGGVPEVVSSGEDGLLVSPGDLDGLIEALRALLSDPARARRYAEAGMRKVESRYLHRHFEARLSGLLDGLSGSAVDGNER